MDEQGCEAIAFATAAQARDAQRKLQAVIAPAAVELLGIDGKIWLAQRWQVLARRASALPFSAGTGAVHAVALCIHVRPRGHNAEVVPGHPLAAQAPG